MKAREYANVERMALATANWLRHRFVPEFLLPAHGEMKDALRRGRGRLKRDLEQTMEGHVCTTYIDETRGLGRFGCGLEIGNLPERLEDYRTIGGLFKTCGLHVEDGKAVRRQKGKVAGFKPILRAYALYRIADPIVKVGGPYRAVYDSRKAYTFETHPEMSDDCEFCVKALGRTKEHRAAHEYKRERTSVGFDCANVGGVHWSKGHRHADALRVTAKAVLRDLWLVAHDKAPAVQARTEETMVAQMAGAV
jgi:hypothetical protein